MDSVVENLTIHSKLNRNQRQHEKCIYHSLIYMERLENEKAKVRSVVPSLSSLPCLLFHQSSSSTKALAWKTWPAY